MITNQLYPMILWLILFTTFSTTSMEAQDSKSKKSKPANSSRLEAKQLRAHHPIELDYLLSLPNDYESKSNWPLLLFLHGAGERGNDLDRVKVHGPPKLIEKGEALPFIVVAPQCPKNRFWEPVSLSALLDEIESKYNVDSDRIYVTGLSMGGFGTWTLAAHTPERFAAIAPICGGGDKFTVPYRIRDHVPAWIFHGAKDRVVPVGRSEEMVEAFKKYQAKIKLTIYPEAGHDSWTQSYNNPKLYEWFLSHQKASE